MAHSNESKTMKNQLDRFKFTKKIIQILLPLSALSLFFSLSSLAPLFNQSYDYVVSNFTFKFKLFTYTTERNCIFLLCNGILVLIIQSSGLISKITPMQSAPKTARVDDHRRRAERDDENTRLEESKKKGVGEVEILEEKVSKNGVDGVSAAEVEEEFRSCGDDDDEEDDGGIDTEELKKKCEDFIKKVKMEIHGA